MDTLNELLVAVVTNPDEDTPRLMYADALDERGEGDDALRAAYIRAQVEIRSMWAHNVPSSEAVSRYNELVKVENDWYDSKEFGDISQMVVGNWDRGFVDKFATTADDFLKVADHLIWNPSMTVEDGKCSCSMYECRDGFVLNLKGKWEQCMTCSGTGKRRVPRPCPPTAQPIRKVVLTTAPEVHLQRYDGSGPLATIDGVKAKYQPHHESVSDMIRELFRREYGTGIEFVLPLTDDNYGDENVGSPSEHLSYP